MAAPHVDRSHRLQDDSAAVRSLPLLYVIRSKGISIMAQGGAVVDPSARLCVFYFSFTCPRKLREAHEARMLGCVIPYRPQSLVILSADCSKLADLHCRAISPLTGALCTGL